MENFGGSLAENVWRKISAFKKYSIFGLGSTLYLSLSVSVCLCLFVSLCLRHCHHQIISFHKIYGLYGLEHHTVEING